jgi:hypothetical protein
MGLWQERGAPPLELPGVGLGTDGVGLARRAGGRRAGREREKDERRPIMVIIDLV